MKPLQVTLDPATATVREVLDVIVATRPRTLADALEAEAVVHQAAADKCTNPMARAAMDKCRRQSLQAATCVRAGAVGAIMPELGLLVPTFRIAAEMHGFNLPQRAAIMARYHHEGTTNGK